MVLLEGLVVKMMASERDEAMSCIVSLAATCSGTFHQLFHFSELLLFLVTRFACFRGVEHKLIWHSCIPYYVSLGSLLGPLLQPFIKKHLMFKCGWSRYRAALCHIFQEQHWGVGKKS